MMRSMMLTCAALGLLAGCEADDSAPSRPRTGNFLTPDQKSQQNAEQRSLEKPPRELPTDRTDLPGQSLAPTRDPRVLTLDATTPPPAPTSAPTPTNPDFPISGFTGPSGWNAIGHTTGPVTTYTRDSYPAVVPHIPANPGTVAMTGSTPIPGGDWAIEHSWGQGLTLTEYPHRDWPQTTAIYQQVNAQHDPLYYYTVQEHLPVKQNDGTLRGDVRSTGYEVPFFFLNTFALPALLVLEPPFAPRSTSVPSADPTYHGHVPGGSTVPAPFPGALKWQYDFLNADGTVKQTNGNAPASAPK